MKNVLKHGAMLQVIEKRVIGQHGHNTHVAWRWWQYQDYVVLLTSFVSSESFTWNCAIIILFYLYVRTVITYADWKWKIDYNSKLSNTYQSYLDLNYRQYPTLAELSARIVIVFKCTVVSCLCHVRAYIVSSIYSDFRCLKLHLPPTP